MIIFSPHRGLEPTQTIRGIFNGDVPENSLASYARVLENPDYTSIDLDLRLTKDGHIVNFNAPSLKNNVIGNPDFQGSGLIAEMTLEEIKQFDLGRGQKIPTFEEILDLVAKDNKRRAEASIEAVKIHVGLKVDTVFEPAYRALSEYFETGLLKKSNIAFSPQDFDLPQLAAIDHLDPDLPLLVTALTKDLFKAEDIDEHYRVREGAVYSSQKLERIKDFFSKRTGETALDMVAWDVRPEIMTFVSELNAPLSITFIYGTKRTEREDDILKTLATHEHRVPKIYIASGKIESVREKAKIIRQELAKHTTNPATKAKP